MLKSNHNTYTIKNIPSKFKNQKSKIKTLRKSILITSVLILTTIGATTYNTAGRKCTGTKNCNACKNCKYCRHCAKNGGTCGVCK
jgi:hypothetical protein